MKFSQWMAAIWTMFTQQNQFGWQGWVGFVLSKLESAYKDIFSGYLVEMDNEYVNKFLRYSVAQPQSIAHKRVAGNTKMDHVRSWGIMHGRT